MAKTKRGGRPPKEDRSQILDQRIVSSYTAAERAELEDLAHEERLARSEYVRRIVVRHLAAKRRRK